MENGHRKLPLILTTAFSSMVAGYIIGSLHAQWPLRDPAVLTKTAVEPGYSRSEGPLPHPSDESIIREMHSYALRHIGVFEDDLQSFGSSKDWAAGWDLYWIDVRHDDSASRIYHVIDAEQPRRRFTTMWNDGEAKWEQSY